MSFKPNSQYIRHNDDEIDYTDNESINRATYTPHSENNNLYYDNDILNLITDSNKKQNKKPRVEEIDYITGTEPSSIKKIKKKKQKSKQKHKDNDNTDTNNNDDTNNHGMKYASLIPHLMDSIYSFSLSFIQLLSIKNKNLFLPGLKISFYTLIHGLNFGNESICIKCHDIKKEQ